MKKQIYIIVSILFIIAGYFGIIRLICKPDIPFEYYTESSKVFAATASIDVNQILAAAGVTVRSNFQLEFVIDSYEIGQKVILIYSDHSGKIHSSDFEIIPYYHNITFILVTSIVGFTFLLMGLFVIVKKTDNIQSLLLYWVLSLFGLAALTSPGHYGVSGDVIGYIIRTLHAISYSSGGLFFILFMISLPNIRLRERKYIVYSLIILTVFVSLFASYAQLNAISDISKIYLFGKAWTLTETWLLSLLIYGTAELIITYKNISGREDKRKIEWIIWGLIAGVSPYVIFWVIPSIIGMKEIVNEEYSLAFLILVPVSFVIAVIKYRVLDIELVVKRSFVYSVLSLCLIGIYIGLIYSANLFFNYILGSETKFVNLLAVLITALSFNPLRNRLNKFADRVFYREKYVFDKAVTEILSRYKDCLTAGELGKAVISQVEKFIPVKAIAVIVLKPDGERLRVLEQKNFDLLSKNIPALRVKKLEQDIRLPFARETKVEKGIDIDTSMEKVLCRWDINAAIPMVPESGKPSGAILLGEKLSGLKYSPLDFELLYAVASSAAHVLKRLELQEKLVQEEIEMSRLEELNELKSFYVASVSHDLKTPLTSIRVFTELMQSNKAIPESKRNDYLSIIENESWRLTRLIDNVLDSAKIEKGIKQYNFAEIELNNVLKEAVKSFEYFINLNKFTLEVKYSENNLRISGDSEAIKSALFNIITNSIKYSGENKQIKMSSGTQNNSAFIEIKDKGIGIPEHEKDMIFDPFIRSRTVENSQVKGAGLGLSIVKHIIDSHNGTIELESKVNSGTTIRLLFPLKNGS